MLSRRRSLRFASAGQAFWRGAVAVMLGVAQIGAAEAAPPSVKPRLALIADPTASREALAVLAGALTPFTVVERPAEAEVAVVWRGPGAAGSAGATALAAFLQRAGPLVVLAADPTVWPGGAPALSSLLGATPGGDFAQGAAPTVLSDYGHPITTGITEPPAPHPLRLWSGFAPDTFVLQEATVGEETVPLAWVRKDSARRLAHLAALTPVSLREATTQRLIAQSVWWALGRPVPNAAPHLQRTVLPDAHPGSFALTLPEGVGLCLDPVRGGINYLWAGEFADPRPRWLTKQGAPVRLDGPIWYRETAEPPWRTAAGGPAAPWRFRGHSTRDGRTEFHYEIAGRPVTERFAAAADGRSLTRQFTVGAGPPALWLRLAPQAGVVIEVAGARHTAEHAGFTGEAAGEFTVRLRQTNVEEAR